MREGQGVEQEQRPWLGLNSNNLEFRIRSQHLEGIEATVSADDSLLASQQVIKCTVYSVHCAVSTVH